MSNGLPGVGAGLQAALLLARGRPEGMARLDLPADAPADAAHAVARHSFWAAAFCLPGFICLHLLDWAQQAAPPGEGRAHGFAVDLLSYVIGWAAFALASHAVAARLGRAARWPRFIALWNWCNVVQYLLLVVGSLPALLGLPDWIYQATWLIALGWAMWLEWFATRLALDLAAGPAAALVALDLLIGLLLVMLSGAPT